MAVLKLHKVTVLRQQVCKCNRKEHLSLGQVTAPTHQTTLRASCFPARSSTATHSEHRFPAPSSTVTQSIAFRHLPPQSHTPSVVFRHLPPQSHRASLSGTFLHSHTEHHFPAPSSTVTHSKYRFLAPSSTVTQSVTFRHLPPNFARTGYATEGALNLYLRAAVHRNELVHCND